MTDPDPELRATHRERCATSIGATLDDRFRIVEPIGAGGMGVVYRGIQLSIDRPVAIKVIRRHLSAHPEMVQRFLREARLLTALNHHPNIVSILELGQTATGQLYLVMELLHGRTLEAELERNGVLEAQRACEIGVQVCDALAAAHARGIAHRDLKPANIIVLDEPAGLVKVLDFGLAKAFHHQRASWMNITATGMIVGTPMYAAPEAMGQGTVDPRSDLYALGCMMYELLTGAPPFVDPAANVVLVRHLVERPAPLPARVPAPVARLVEALLAKEPDARPASAAAVRAELRTFLRATASISGRAPRNRRLRRSSAEARWSPSVNEDGILRLDASAHGSAPASWHAVHDRMVGRRSRVATALAIAIPVIAIGALVVTSAWPDPAPAPVEPAAFGASTSTSGAVAPALGTEPARAAIDAPPIAASIADPARKPGARRRPQRPTRPDVDVASVEPTPRAPPSVETLLVPPPPMLMLPAPPVVPREITIAPDALRHLRRGGTTEIYPSLATQTRMVRDGRDRSTATLKVCIAADGAVAGVSAIRTTGYPEYDRQLIATVRTWRYLPYVVDGVATPACSSITFRYENK